MNVLLVSNAALWVVLIVLTVVVAALMRQLGVLHERISPAGVVNAAKGVKVGELAPALTAAAIDGRMVAIGGARSDARSQLLLFVSPTCPICKTLLPVAKRARESEQARLEIVLSSDGEGAAQQEFVAAEGLAAFPYLVSGPLGISYQVSRLPFAALIDATGVLRARGVLNSSSQLDRLLDAHRRGESALQDSIE